MSVTRIVKRNVQSSKLVKSSFDQRLYRAWVADVGGNSYGPATRTLDFMGELNNLLFAPRRQHYGSSRFREYARSSRSDTTASSCHNGNFALQETFQTWQRPSFRDSN
jgi:hypothetical protein